MMMVILIVDGELMDAIEMMADNQADLVVTWRLTRSPRR